MRLGGSFDRGPPTFPKEGRLDLTKKEILAWSVWGTCTVAAVAAGYITGGIVGALSAYAATGSISAAVLANQARNTNTGGRT